MAQPRRGEIWLIKLPTDPPEKGGRPVIVVSIEARNQHERATTALVVPLSTTLRESPTHIRLLPGETGLREPCEAQAENLTTVRKTSLLPPREPLRHLSETKLRHLARCVVLALGFLPEQL
jgi:mRNA-degrading endonuclease toxin of MazEF toxin-antitoxin module